MSPVHFPPPPRNQVIRRLCVEKRLLFNAFSERHGIKDVTVVVEAMGGGSGSQFNDTMPSCANLSKVRV